MPQYKTLPRDTCDINRGVRGSAPPSHSWMAPLVEDMLHDVRTGLTEAVVTGQVGQFFSIGDIQWERA